MGIKTSQILAAGFPSFGPAVITADNSVLVAGVINRIVLSGSDPMPILLPPAPTHGLLVGFAVTDRSAGFSLQLNGNGKNIQPTIPDSATSPLSLDQGAQSGLLRFDSSEDVWIFVSTAATIFPVG
jgi:hypothetical protein